MNKNFSIPKLKYVELFIAISIFACTPAQADVLAIDTTDASGWILENYAGGGQVVIWNTPAKCDSGQQNIFLPSPTTAEINRLWSTVVSAKLTGARIFVRYNTASCSIESFGYR